jgi:hypothetical protein
MTSIILMVLAVVFVGWFGTRTKKSPAKVLNPELLKLARENRRVRMVNIYE